MSAKHDRVIAALERREPDRVPTMDMMVEYSNIQEILGRKTIPFEPVLTKPYVARAIDFLGTHRPRASSSRRRTGSSGTASACWEIST
jgi:hypothetical protein